MKCSISAYYSFQPQYGPRVDPASNRNEYQEYFPGGQKQLVHRADSLTDCFAIWEPQPPGTLKACNGIALAFMALLISLLTDQ